MKKIIAQCTFILTISVLCTNAASAHVVVKPSSVGIGSSNTFTLSVPSEKPEATTGVRIIIPPGLSEVTPDVTPGWQVHTKKGTDDTVTEIDWTGGSIPADFREEFSFGAQVPATPTTLAWKAYQIYADGSVVSWDQAAMAGGDDDSDGNSGPYSKTVVMNDLAQTPAPVSHTAQWSWYLAVLALIVAAFALTRSRSRLP